MPRRRRRPNVVARRDGRPERRRRAATAAAAAARSSSSSRRPRRRRSASTSAAATACGRRSVTSATCRRRSSASTSRTASRPTTSRSRARKRRSPSSRAAAKDASEVFIATDPDREGEAIALARRDADQAEAGAPQPIRRVLFHEITKDAVQRGDRERRRHRQQDRSRRSRRVACSIASSATRRVRSSGRRSRRDSPPVACRRSRCGCIVEREREIRAFKPRGVLDASKRCWRRTAQQFTAKLHHDRRQEGRDPQRGRSASVDRSTRRCKARRKTFDRHRGQAPRAPQESVGAVHDVARCSRKRRRSSAFGSKRTMRVAQDLYEGIELGDEGAVGSHHLHAYRLDARGRERGAAGARLSARAVRRRVSRQRRRSSTASGKGRRTRRTRTRPFARRIRRAGPTRCRNAT